MKIEQDTKWKSLSFSQFPETTYSKGVERDYSSVRDYEVAEYMEYDDSEVEIWVDKVSHILEG